MLPQGHRGWGCACSQTKSRTLRLRPAWSSRSHVLYNLQGPPTALCPLQGATGASVRERWSHIHERRSCADGPQKRRNWALPLQFLDSRMGLLRAQQLMTKKADDSCSCHSDHLSGFDLNTMPWQRGATRPQLVWRACRGLSDCRSGRLHDTRQLHVRVSVWHRLGHHGPADVATLPWE